MGENFGVEPFFLNVCVGGMFAERDNRFEVKFYIPLF